MTPTMVVAFLALCIALLRNGRGKPAGIVTIAIARELVGTCWEIATAP
jgi:hypothetical protein